MKEVVFRTAALAELREAWAWYEGQRPVLGHELMEEVDRVSQGIARMPELHPIVIGDARRVGCQRFPYSLYFLVEDRQVVVLAVLNDRRSRKVFTQRLSDE